MDSLSALEVLKEIKQIMDDRLGSKLSESEDPKDVVKESLDGSPSAKGLEVSKVKVLGDKPGMEEGLSPEEDLLEDAKETSDISPDLLRKIRESLA